MKLDKAPSFAKEGWGGFSTVHYEDPYRLVSELDSERFEIRKLEYFKNGVIQYADEKM